MDYFKSYINRIKEGEIPTDDKSFRMFMQEVSKHVDHGLLTRKQFGIIILTYFHQQGYRLEIPED